VLARARGDRGNTPQIVAAHLDIVLIVTSPGRLLPPRVERYLARCMRGIAPVIVLNKSDLADDRRAFVSNWPWWWRCPYTPSPRDRRRLPGARSVLQAQTTIAVVGSSGVGKSTIANRSSRRPLRDRDDSRVRRPRKTHHDARELIALPSGSWLIDTPGMRAFARGPTTLRWRRRSRYR